MVHENEARFKRVIGENLSRYPMMECTDLYKLIYQASMGSSHGVTRTGAVLQRLQREMEEMPDGPPEPLLDVISDDGLISRINLRPFRSAGGNPVQLMEAFIRTAEEFKGSWKKLEVYMRSLAEMSRECLLPRSLANIDGFLGEMKDSGYPAVHHSREYVRLYAPAYRVVLSSLLEELIPLDIPPRSPAHR